MRILFINHNVAWSGGTFYRAFYFARYLTQRGHDCTLLTISKNNHFQFKEYLHEGVKIVETPDLLPGIGRTGWDIWDTLQRIIWGLKRKDNFDLIHALDCRPVVILPALVLKRLAGIPMVIDWADWWGRGGLIRERGYGIVDQIMEPIETWFEEKFRSEADATTVISKSLMERAIKLGVKPETILLLPQGCDENKFLCVGRDTARSRLGIPDDLFIVSYLGKLISTDQDLLIQTIRAVEKQISKFKFFHIGTPGQNVSNDLLSSGTMVQTGKVDSTSLGLNLCASNLFILPLRDTLGNRARWPSKINDYLSAGRPIVATRVSDIVDYFERNQIGLLAQPEVNDLADKVIQMYQSKDVDEMGINALKLAQNELSWENLINHLENLYQHLFSTRYNNHKRNP
jgi:glycosyltransferase involved in cell wall biosynthesis